MAIHDRFEAVVRVNGQSVTEYEVDDAEQLESNTAGPMYPIVSKYIEASEDQHFSIRLKILENYEFSSHFDKLAFYFYIDGNFCSGKLCTKQTYDDRPSPWTHDEEGRYSGDASSGWFVEKFQFKTLEITQESDRDDFDRLKRKYDLKGVISVQVWPYEGQRSEDQKLTGETWSSEAVPEKALKGKAITMAAGLGNKVSCRAANVYHGRPVGTHPLVVFKFHYRSRKSLEDLMIIERPRSPTPLEDRDPETLTADEMRELLRRQRAERTARSMKLKKSRDSSVKRERPTSLYDDDELQIIKKPCGTHDPTEVIEIDSD